jgi:hypothetical protein
MSYSTQVQHFESVLQEYQLLQNQTEVAKPEQFVGTTEALNPTLIPQLDPVTLMQYGGITVAIIRSIAFLILALAEYNKVLLPVMLQKRDEKNK